jgi:hypothetical protein
MLLLKQSREGILHAVIPLCGMNMGIDGLQKCPDQKPPPAAPQWRRLCHRLDSTQAAMQSRCCLSSLHKCSTSRALLRGHGHAAAQQHGAVVSDDVKVDVELEAFKGLGGAHAHEVACACPALRGRERAKR